MYGYCWVKIDVGRYWDLKGLNTVPIYMWCSTLSFPICYKMSNTIYAIHLGCLINFFIFFNTTIEVETSEMFTWQCCK